MRQRKGLYTSTAATGPTPPGLDLQYQDRGHSESDLSTYSFTLGLGQASADRIVLLAVCLSGTVGTQITSVSTGGVNATRVGAQSPISTRILEFWFAALPTGSSASIDVVHGVASNTRCSVDCWTITGSAQGAPPAQSPLASLSSTTGIATDPITLPVGGCGVAAVFHNTAAGASVAWSQTSGAGIAREGQVGAAARVSLYETFASGSQAFEATHNGAASNMRIKSITWGA